MNQPGGRRRLVTIPAVVLTVGLFAGCSGSPDGPEAPAETTSPTSTPAMTTRTSALDALPTAAATLSTCAELTALDAAGREDYLVPVLDGLWRKQGATLTREVAADWVTTVSDACGSNPGSGLIDIMGAWYTGGDGRFKP